MSSADVSAPTIVLSPKELDLEREAAKVEIVQRMVQQGFSADTVSLATGVKLEIIKRVVLRNKLTPEQEMLSDMARQVMAKSLAYMLYILEQGDPLAKFQVATRTINAAMKLIGAQNDTASQYEEALNAMLALQRDIHPAVDPAA